MIYDRFQKEAIQYIKEGNSVLVCAPTGSGKTLIAEHLLEDCIKRETGCIYTAPIKALSNQKFRDFKKLYGERIGILTGDVSINPKGLILIMTTEIFRNKILDEPDSLKKFNWIIFDEIHYLDDYERGTVWEESLILLPPHLNILGLSATVPNVAEVAEWIRKIHNRPLKVVIEGKRPVPLHFLFQYQNQILDNIKELKNLFYKSRYSYFQRSPKFYAHLSLHPNRLSTLINYIKENEGLPCIYFSFSRRRCEELAEELRIHDFLNKEESKRIQLMYDSLCEDFELNQDMRAGQMYHLIKRGIAYHHAGMLPTLKEIIERLFTSRLLKVIFTTETFALGINMPARTVIFDELRKFYGRYVRNLKTRDFHQMAGRAGRRGMDEEGYVYCRINPHRIKMPEILRTLYGNPEEVKSQFNNSYATLLHLYDKYKESLYEIYNRSLHCFQSREQEKRCAKSAIKAKIELLRYLGCIEGKKLTPKGLFASQLYGYELCLAQIFQSRILEQLDKVDLALLACSLVYEPKRADILPSLSHNSKRLKKLTDEIIEEIHHREKKFKIRPLSKKPFYHLSNCLEAWMKGRDFLYILRFTKTDEGELIRYFRMAAQILREILKAPSDSRVLRKNAAEALAILNRGIVDAERQLRRPL